MLLNQNLISVICRKKPKTVHYVDPSFYPSLLLLNPSSKSDYCPVCSQDALMHIKERKSSVR